MRDVTIGARAVASASMLALFGAAHPAMAQDAPTPYPTMAPFEEYLMPDRDAEIALARSAAPESVSRDATILVLGREGFETAVEGTNGFVCMVDRGWTGPFEGVGPDLVEGVRAIKAKDGPDPGILVNTYKVDGPLQA